MPLSSIQLLDPHFQANSQTGFWSEEMPDLQYVVKLHRSTRLHLDFRLLLFDRLLSFAVNDLESFWKDTVHAVRVDDNDPQYLLGESNIPTCNVGAGPTLVWDYGIYRSHLGKQEDIYQQLLNGCLEIDLLGIRLHGRLKIFGHGKHWQILRLSGEPFSPSQRSVLTGRSLDEIEFGTGSNQSAKQLWLDWEHFYTHQTIQPEVAVIEKKVADLNFAARTRGIAVGMTLQHVLPLVPDCQVQTLSPSHKRQKAWLDQLIPFSNTIQPFEMHSAAIDLSRHPDPNDMTCKVVNVLTRAPFGHLRFGTGSSIWLAKLASQLKDPFAFAIEPAKQLAPLAVKHLLPVSLSVRESLYRLGFKTIGEVAEVSPERLYSHFGASAHHIIASAQGRTCEQALALYPPQGVCKTISFSAPVNDSLRIQAAADTLSRQLAATIAGRMAGLVILTAELESGTEHDLIRPYNRPVHSLGQIRASLNYLAGELQKSCPNIVRLTVRLDRLESVKGIQKDLFVTNNQRESHLALDSLKFSLGDSAVVRASQMEIPRRVQVLKVWRDATGWN